MADATNSLYLQKHTLQKMNRVYYYHCCWI